MTITYKFERDAGHRFCKDGVSILLHAPTAAKKGVVLTHTDCVNLFRHLSEYLEAIGTYSLKTSDFGKVLTISDFPSLENVVFYKFGAEHMLNDSFQFGSIGFYRNIEKPSSKDDREGFCNLVISTRARVIGASVVAGYNDYLLCGSSSLDNRTQMSNRFGPNIIKISDVKGF